MNAMNETSLTKSADPVCVFIVGALDTSSGSAPFNGLENGRSALSAEKVKQIMLHYGRIAAEAKDVAPVAGGSSPKVNPATGNRYIDGGSRWKQFITDFKLKFPTPGLKASLHGSSILFEYTSQYPIDEADARDAQCRAGYSDTGYGFYGFGTVERAGGYFATWACQVSCD